MMFIDFGEWLAYLAIGFTISGVVNAMRIIYGSRSPKHIEEQAKVIDVLRERVDSLQSGTNGTVPDKFRSEQLKCLSETIATVENQSVPYDPHKHEWMQHEPTN